MYGSADPEWNDEPKVPAGATRLVGIVRSGDNGQTWQDFTMVSTDNNHNETALLALTDKHILAASRTYSRGNVDVLESYDAGRTWSTPRSITQNSQHPADLIRLAGGKKIYADYDDDHHVRQPVGHGSSRGSAGGD